MAMDETLSTATALGLYDRMIAEANVAGNLPAVAAAQQAQLDYIEIQTLGLQATTSSYYERAQEDAHTPNDTANIAQVKAVAEHLFEYADRLNTALVTPQSASVLQRLRELNSPTAIPGGLVTVTIRDALTEARIDVTNPSSSAESKRFDFLYQGLNEMLYSAGLTSIRPGEMVT
jgi:hypothetical protein